MIGIFHYPAFSSLLHWTKYGPLFSRQPTHERCWPHSPHTQIQYWKHYDNKGSSRQMRLTKEARVRHLNTKLLYISSTIHFTFSFSIHLSPGGLHFISRSIFFHRIMCYWNIWESKISPFQIVCSIKEHNMVLFLYRKSYLLPLRAIFRFLTYYYYFRSYRKSVILRGLWCDTTLLFILYFEISITIIT